MPLKFNYQHRRKAMIHQHITLQSLFVSKKTEEIYAKIIAEEDIKEIYGKEIILQKGLLFPR